MKLRLRWYVFLSAALLILASVAACRQGSAPERVPVTLPTASPTQSVKPLSASDLMQMEEFSTQRQAIEQDWDQLHRDFDAWRNGLTSCSRSSVEEALQDFAVSFNGITTRTRYLSRSEDTREPADILIAAAEAEETAYRRLRDHWQPNVLSLFENVEIVRSESTGAQRAVEDTLEELRDELEDLTDQQQIQNVEEFSAAFGPIFEAWTEFHDEYGIFLQISDNLSGELLASRIEALAEQFSDIVDDVRGLPDTKAVEEKAGMLLRMANAESSALEGLLEALTAQSASVPAFGVPPGASAGAPAEGTVAAYFEAMDVAINESESALKDAQRAVSDVFDGSALSVLEEIKFFTGQYEYLRNEWDSFHQMYNEWRRTNGGCDEGEVLGSIAEFNSRISEIGRRVRDLPQSGYLLPAYSLLVEAAAREEGAIRTLQNNWQPFTVDVFIAVDTERVNANGLRREANIALQELRSRASAP